MRLFGMSHAWISARDRRGVATAELALILPVLVALAFPVADVAAAVVRMIGAYQTLRGLGAYAQFHPPADVTNISAWTLPAVPGFTVSAQVLCGDTASACTSNTVSPKWVSLATTVTLSPHVLALCPPPNGCRIVHTERFQ
ncbi:hypothetical protein JMJ55_13350 [Belnapia sp. T6]|uniref:TadE-like protein n=1 Tax=Belnapia mucosa TaxID=2804532 RepID=A0ABS1V3P5_9PROT|nr:hypothetical protein [Belnapia mucosa]MBL6456314.1 hypothetical protein [Belnapia mucosa]